jgi:branched-chain amino acid aminotransferase
VVVADAGAVLDTRGWGAKPFRLAISSWRRIEDNSVPPRIKSAANYQNARLALLQGEEDGYDGVLMLDTRGHITEEARACFFMVRGGEVITPPITSDILESISRDTAIELLREQHGMMVQQREVDRTEAYVADEVFLCGTALGVTPVGRVDRFDVGDGGPGPITSALAASYVETTTGSSGLHPEWRTAVYE